MGGLSIGVSIVLTAVSIQQIAARAVAAEASPIDWQKNVPPSDANVETVLWRVPEGKQATFEVGQLNFMSGSLDGPTPDFWLYARQVSKLASGYGDGWTLIRSAEVHRVDGKTLREGGRNNNCVFGVDPGLGDTAPCYPVNWTEALTVYGPSDIELIHGPDGPNDGYEVRLSGVLEPA